MSNDRLRQLVVHAAGTAGRDSMPGEEAVALHLGLAFFLGIGVDHDPQFPWVASIVSDPVDPVRSGAGPGRESRSGGPGVLATGG